MLEEGTEIRRIWVDESARRECAFVPPPAPKIDRFRPVDFLSIAKAMVYHRHKAHIITRSVYLISRRLYYAFAMMIYKTLF